MITNKQKQHMKKVLEENKLLKKFKEDFEDNIQTAIDREEKVKKELKKNKELLNKTETDRLKLHKENISLKEELGILLFVKEVLETAKIYGYNDLSKVQQIAKHQEKLREMR